MKLFLFNLLVVLLSTSAFAEIDYKYCSKFISDTNADVQKTGFSFPFTIDAKTGALKTTNHGLDYNNENETEHVYTYSDFNRSIKITLSEASTNKIEKIIIEKSTKTPNPNSKVLTEIDFKIQNGKCIPQIGRNTVNVNGKKIVSTIFDTKLCRELKNYFDKNKELKKCFNPESRENKNIESLLERGGYNTVDITQRMAQFTPILSRYNYSIEQKILTGTSKAFDLAAQNSDQENKTIQGVLGGSSVISGYMILSDCNEKGLNEVASDNSVWSVKEASSSPEAPEVIRD